MAVKALLHYALEVPDQSVGQRYYRDFGLTETVGGNVVRLRAPRQQHDNVLLYEGPRKRLHHLCFGAPGAAFAETREAMRRAGASRDAGRAGAGGARARRLRARRAPGDDRSPGSRRRADAASDDVRPSTRANTESHRQHLRGGDHECGTTL